jgi:hypothetical protein
LSVATLKAWNGIKKNVQRGMTLVVRQASTNTVLTTETGQRQVLASKSHMRILKVVERPEPQVKSRGAAKPTAKGSKSVTGKATSKAVGVKGSSKGTSKVAKTRRAYS